MRTLAAGLPLPTLTLAPDAPAQTAPQMSEKALPTAAAGRQPRTTAAAEAKPAAPRMNDECTSQGMPMSVGVGPAIGTFYAEQGPGPCAVSATFGACPAGNSCNGETEVGGFPTRFGPTSALAVGTRRAESLAG